MTRLHARARPPVPDDPERAFEVPHGVAPAVLAEEPEEVAEPAQRVGVGGLVVAAELAAADTRVMMSTVSLTLRSRADGNGTVYRLTDS